MIFFLSIPEFPDNWIFFIFSWFHFGTY